MMQPKFIGSQYNLVIPRTPKSLIRVAGSDSKKLAGVRKNCSLFSPSEMLLDSISNNHLHFELKKCLPNRKRSTS
jgi:hypothetical protein